MQDNGTAREFRPTDGELLFALGARRLLPERREVMTPYVQRVSEAESMEEVGAIATEYDSLNVLQEP
jgi:hypothetical protein